GARSQVEPGDVSVAIDRAASGQQQRRGEPPSHAVRGNTQRPMGGGAVNVETNVLFDRGGHYGRHTKLVPIPPPAKTVRLLVLEIRADHVVDLHELDRRPADLDEGDQDATAGTVRLDNDVLVLEGSAQVVDLESHVRHGLDQVGIGRILPVALPLDAERISLMIANGQLQVRQRDLAVEGTRGRDPDVVELHRTAFDRLPFSLAGGGFEPGAVYPGLVLGWSGAGLCHECGAVHKRVCTA